jgi:hypothetical protein
LVMFATQPIFGLWNFKAENASLRSVTRPPSLPQYWTSVFLAQPLLWRRHFPLSPVTIGTPRSAMT